MTVARAVELIVARMADSFEIQENQNRTMCACDRMGCIDGIFIKREREGWKCSRFESVNKY